MRIAVLSVVCTLVGLGSAASTNGPRPLMVDCLSLSTGDFRSRLKTRDRAEDQSTLWLLKGEQLTINFELPWDTQVQVLDIRYSNDGQKDEIGVLIDNEVIGQFETSQVYGWGLMWNMFRSSGPVGQPRVLTAGKHSLTVKILEADGYGVEIDYIRLNVHGTALYNKEDFICVHKPMGVDEGD